ncbi:MAG: hypothetical protein PF961_00150 [Planctomycetota bacterium]|jgi:heterodisulfide reductase subunit C|nr:hypothetical protein [Planctomycetota bacterium]
MRTIIITVAAILASTAINAAEAPAPANTGKQMACAACAACTASKEESARPADAATVEAVRQALEQIKDTKQKQSDELWEGFDFIYDRG